MMCRTSILLAAIWLNLIAGAVSAQGTWETTLQGRDLDGDPTTIEAYYDTVLNITWLADANIAVSNSFGVYVDNDGGMTWNRATQYPWLLDRFVGAVNAAHYLGGNQWRLPTLRQIAPPPPYQFNLTWKYDGSSDYGSNVGAPSTIYAGSTASEMAHLFYTTLGNTSIYDKKGNSTGCGLGPLGCLTNAGPFKNIQTALRPYCCTGSSYYWAHVPGRSWGPRGNKVWVFGFQNGIQRQFSWGAHYFVWLVHDGDLLVVDNDGDGVYDDLCPGTVPESDVDVNGCADDQVDMDKDGLCDPEAKSSGPSACEGVDNCPVIANPFQDNIDKDSLGDICDDDDDNDSVPDIEDNCPLIANPEQIDLDSDGIGSSCDSTFNGDRAVESIVVRLLDVIKNNPGDCADKVEGALASANTAIYEFKKGDNEASLGNIEGVVGDIEAAVKDDVCSVPDELTNLMARLTLIARSVAEGAVANSLGDTSDSMSSLVDGDTLRSNGFYKDAANKYKDVLAKVP